jgi:hypothetical protein
VAAVAVMAAIVAATAIGLEQRDVPPRQPDHGPEAPDETVDMPEAPELWEYDLDEPRVWLRSVSTAPVRARLADRDADLYPPDGLQPHNPRIRVDEPTAAALATVRDTAGVALATEVRLHEMSVRHPGGRSRLEVAFVDPEQFRVVTPGVTAEAEPLWRALGDGDIALTHDAAQRLGVGPGVDVGLGPFLRRTRARVAATMSLGRAEIADAVMHTDVLGALDVDAEPVLLVGVERLDELEEVVARLQRSGVGEVSPLPDIEPYHASLVGDDEATAEAFEPFTFHQGDGGRIAMDPAWVEEHIVRVDLPVLGPTRCHRLIVPQLRAALEEIVARELDHLLDADDYGGCWVPRHIGWDATRGLSLHAWGVAFDVNVRTNPYGERPQLDPRLVEVFERYGFNWGGRWRSPDGMHFELGELLDPAAMPGPDSD